MRKSLGDLLLPPCWLLHCPASSLCFRSPIAHRLVPRSYSTEQPPRPVRYLRSRPLSLDHFLLRQQTLTLYRSIIRSCYRLPDPQTKDEMMGHARAEFERQKEVTDTRKIRYLLSTGRAEWKKLAGMFGGALPF